MMLRQPSEAEPRLTNTYSFKDTSIASADVIQESSAWDDVPDLAKRLEEERHSSDRVTRVPLSELAHVVEWACDEARDLLAYGKHLNVETTASRVV
jgi:hypothetical protein